MSLRHADQIHASVQASVESEIRRLGIYAALVLIAAGYRQQILSLLQTQIGNVRTKNRITALMSARLGPVHIDNGLLSRRQDLHIHSAPCQGL